MKNPIVLVSLVLALFFNFGCQNKAEKAELEKFKAQAALEEQNKALAQRFFDEFNKQNLEIFNELCAPDYKYYLPSYNPKPFSLAEQIEEEKNTFKGMPDFKLRIDKLFADGDTVMIWGVISGTHQGEFMGIPPTGNRIEASTIILMRLRDAKIIETRQEADALGLFQQLGLELKPKEVKK